HARRSGAASRSQRLLLAGGDQDGDRSRAQTLARWHGQSIAARSARGSGAPQGIDHQALLRAPHMMAPSMIERSTTTTLGALARGVGGLRIVGDSSVRVTGVRQDSRHLVPGELFAVRGGARTTGWNFVSDALTRGAVAVMADADLVSLPVPM